MLPLDEDVATVEVELDEGELVDEELELLDEELDDPTLAVPPPIELLTLRTSRAVQLNLSVDGCGSAVTTIVNPDVVRSLI